MSKVLIALGGNALGNSPSEQKEAVKTTAKAIVNLSKNGHKVIICHGNGPQVGMIQNSFDNSYKSKLIKESVPLVECGAMSQGYIGYHLQNAIQNEIKKQNISLHAVSIITQTLVDKNDQAFIKPTKPVGDFMDINTAKKMASEKEWSIVEDAGRGWRRVVPSPKPIDIIEKETIKFLYNKDFIVIAGGGGGIPVFQDGDILQGVDAVIDKDFTSAKLAELVQADVFIVLTAVPQVMINYGKENQEGLSEVSISKLKTYIDEKQFAPGSMLPKIEAAIRFTSSTNKPSFIGELKDAVDILAGKTGTKIIGE